MSFKFRFYVYRLVDPRDCAPFYVGKGQANRAWSHTKLVKVGRSSGNPAKDARIADILDADLEPTVEIVAYHADEPTAFAHEIELIANISGLLNIRKGGEGWSLSEDEANRRMEKRRLDRAAKKDAENISYLTKWLKMVDRWPNGGTFPGLKNGDNLAAELIDFVRNTVSAKPDPKI